MIPVPSGVRVWLPGRGREGLAKCGTAGFPATNTEPSSPRGNVATIFSAWTWVTETALAGWACFEPESVRELRN